MSLVKMVRKLAVGESGPTTADVHSDMVEDYMKAGWVPEQQSAKPSQTSDVSQASREQSRPAYQQRK